jgi:lipopolysaccharide export system protein LptC
MARGYDDTHSWLVMGAKIVLPLIALSLLATLFLVSERIDPSQPIPYADIDLVELAREPRMTEPHFAGVTVDGAALTVSASGARPDAVGNGASATGIVVRIDSPGVFSADIVADEGRLDPIRGEIRLRGAVSLRTSAGYAIASDAVSISTDSTRLESPLAVMADAPFGQLSAGAMILSTTGAGAPYLLVFNAGVKLIYHPVN